MIPSGSPGISVAGWTEARTALQDAITNADALTVEPKAALDDAAKKADDALARN
jgi:hypothetical protein